MDMKFVNGGNKTYVKTELITDVYFLRIMLGKLPIAELPVMRPVKM